MKPHFLAGISLSTAVLTSPLALWAQTTPTKAGNAPTAIAAKAAPGASVQTFTLANGMTLWVKPDRRAPTAVHMVWLRVGAMDEVDGTSGVAHVLEHMLFKGTPSVAAGEFSRRVAALGGRENAFTAKDYTGYYQQIPSSQLEAVMRLESDRFANNQWADVEFAKELEVVKEERRMRTEDNPRAQLHEMLSATALTASPYRRPIVGWMSDLEAMTAQDARDFFRKWYTPANAVVVVAGDVDPVQVKALADKYYGGIASHALPERKPQQEPAQQGLRRLEFKAPAEQSYVTLAFKVPRLTSLQATPEHDDALALTVLAAVLDGYSGARLERALTQGEQRLADSVGAHNGLMGRGPQFFYLDGVPAKGQTPEALEAALRAQVQRVANEGVTESELQRVKTQWVASEVYKLDSVFNQARELGVAWVLGMPPDHGTQLLARLRQVTAAQVQAVAQKYFGDDSLTVGILRPQPLSGQPRVRRAPAGARH
ncbi:M16 family metallopeptidase [Limnohabitans planktonicus]|uniref:Peptidase M16 n=1 Tax=Limnohabitans planktonicus II-D5 TaxID=1293045 RepID=A0A2T7UFF3_9BURK|nr:pitrilysin family protein [Limnohabitans planktonicus]PVE43423.1 peptidase M16 [Limnohabitans planktonicus II-D5]|eukprot:gene21505-27540_t